MRERPILFSAPMVRAILAGTKTQTRRVAKLNEAGRVALGGRNWHCADPKAQLACPYGQPGDRLWVRETFGHFERNENFNPGAEVFYRADGNCLALEPWRPSIHMPRWASRITLEVTGARVERLQDISEEDAKAEGARRFDDIPIGTSSAHPCRWSMELPENTDQCLISARYAFANLFCKMNGKNKFDHSPWDANPLVWVTEFRRLL